MNVYIYIYIYVCIYIHTYIYIQASSGASMKRPYIRNIMVRPKCVHTSSTIYMGASMIDKSWISCIYTYI